MQAEAATPQNEIRRRLLLAISFIIHNAGDNLPAPDEMCRTPGCLSDPGGSCERGAVDEKVEIAGDKRHIMRPPSC